MSKQPKTIGVMPLLMATILLPATIGFAQTVSFSPPMNFPVGTRPNRVAIGDLNGDGKPDLAVAKFEGNTISILLGDNTGSFGAPLDLLAVSQPRSVAIADLDGDSKPDLAVTNLSCCFATPISVFRNTSTGGSLSFAPKVDFAIGFQPYNIGIGDIDGDGKPDLVAVLISQFAVAVLRNTSTSGNITSSSFAPPVSYATGINPWGVAIGDIDGDGKPDLAVVNLNNGTASVFRNTSTIGSISFAPKVDFATGASPRSAAIADLDGDGKPDLAVANQNSNSVSVLRNTSTIGSITASSFAAKVDFGTGFSPYSVSIGDLDGDGKPDLAVTNQSSNSVSVLRNTSTSGSITASSFAGKMDFTTGSWPIGGAIGDLNGDGKPDLAVANLNSNNVSILLNTTAPPNQPPVADAGPDQTIEATSPAGASITLNGSGSSDPDGDPLTYNWTGPFGTISGVSPTGALPLGTHTLTLIVGDGQATATDTVTVTVVDTTPPDTTISSAVDGNGAAVASSGSTLSNSISFTFGGTDAVGVAGFQCSLDGAAFTPCTSPVVYSALAVGNHTFQVRAFDTAGNVDPSPASFTWAVITPAQAIQNLIAAINGMGLPTGVANSLSAPLGNIDPNNQAAACGKLGAFINQVNTKAQSGQLTPSQASQLLQATNAIKASLGCSP